MPGKEFGLNADVVGLDGQSVMSETISMTLRLWDGETHLGVGEAGTPMPNE